MSQTMQKQALEYAAKGWPIFPCSPGTKDGKGRSKHPLLKAGFKAATTDQVQIENWWRKWPDALIGVVPGQIDAFVVDLDPKGDETPEHVLARLEEAIGCSLPETARVLTQSGGWHLWFKKPAGVTIGNRKPCAGVDFRCDNGYVIVPPSQMKNGNRYEWDVPLVQGMADAPQALLDAAIKPAEQEAVPQTAIEKRDLTNPGEQAVRRYVHVAIDNAAAEMANAPKGQRGHTLNAIAFSLGKFVGAGALTEREVWAALSTAADHSGLTATDGSKERDAKIKRGLEAGIAQAGEVKAKLDEVRENGARRKYNRRNPSPQSSPAANLGTIPTADKALPRDARNAELIAQDPKLTDCSGEPETDIGNGRRFLHRHRSKVMHVPNVGWHIYDGRRWKWDETDSQIRKLAHDTAERIANERFLIEYLSYEQRIIDEAADGLPEYNELKNKKPKDLGDEQKERLRDLRQLMDEADQTKKALQSRRSSRQRHAKSSAGSSKIDNILREAQPYITKELSELDGDPLSINCLNGLLVFKEHHYSTGPYWDLELKPHRQDAYVTKLVQAEYDPDARAPNFHKFLDEVQPDEEVRNYIQRFLGYSLTGLTHEQVFAFFHGGGRNGKSTLVDIVCRIMDDYSTTVPIETLAGDQKRKGSDATPDLMRVPGARFVRASEPESNMKFKESMIKSLTSDEPILIRGLNKEFNEVYPNFKLVISGNHKPQIHNDDHGIWRRVMLVPWAVQVPPEKVDKMLGKKLWDERNGIFAWLIQGVLEYLTNGLNPPEAVLAATAEYRSDSNPIGAFLKTYCAITNDEDDVLAAGELHKFYEKVREIEAWPHFNISTFQKRLPDQTEALGILKCQIGGRRRYRCVKLRTDLAALAEQNSAIYDDFGSSHFDPPEYQR